MAYSLGVDIGSTYTAAAIWRDGSVQSVPLGNRANAVPSVLFLRDDGVLLVGEAAVRRAVVEPDRQARDFKRRMGDEVPLLLGDDTRMSAYELTGHLLRWVIERVTEREGERPGHLVLTHPAEWGDYRRDLLIQAAATADFHDVGLLTEPVAAAAWYAVQSRVPTGALVGVYDLGGGTFDASVVRKTQTGFEVVGEPGGDDAIGGLVFDHALLRYVAAAAGVDFGALDDADPAVATALGTFRDAVVDAKEALSADTETVVPVLFPGVSGHVTLGRTHLESLVRPQIQGTVALFGQIVARAGVDPGRLHAVLLIGGSSRIPLVSQLLRAELGVPVALDAHPKYAVSLGAAITGAPRVSPLATTIPLVSPPIEPVAEPVTEPIPVVESPPGPDEEPTAALTLLDLAGAGLTEAMDLTVEIPVLPALPRPVVTDRDVAPVVVRTGAPGSGYWGRAAWTAVIAFLVIAVVVAAIVVLALHRSGPSRSSGGATSGEPRGTAPSGGVPVGLAGQLVAAPPGPDAMRAVAAVDLDDLVAVGLSVDLHARAWVRHGAGDWTPVAVPAPDTSGVNDVAVNRGRVVAVGFAGTASARRPAVWTGTTGDSWAAAALSPDLRPAGLTELTAVTGAGATGFLAIGTDRTVDTVDGDAAVFRSDDGITWHRVAATGLDGPGPQEVHRLVHTDSGYVAVGSALVGAARGPALWTSPDGVKWQPMLSVPAGSPTLWAVLPLPQGRMLTCGAAGPVEQPVPGCWLLREGTWERLDLLPDVGAPSPRALYGLAQAGDGIVGVGTAHDDIGVDAAVWHLRLPVS